MATLRKKIKTKNLPTVFFFQSDKADIIDLIESEAKQKSKKLLFYKVLHYINIFRQRLNFRLLTIPENSSLLLNIKNLIFADGAPRNFQGRATRV